MKMAKASEADISMAMTLANYLDAIDKGHMPDALSEDPESIEWLDRDDREQYARLLDGLQSLLRTGSISRVVFGMAVICDPANECIDPNADTIAHHPMRQLLEQQRDDAVKQAAAVNEQFIEISRHRDELLESIVKAREEMACANFNGAAERIDHAIASVKGGAA